jgi:hypothetical protein
MQLAWSISLTPIYAHRHKTPLSFDTSSLQNLLQDPSAAVPRHIAQCSSSGGGGEFSVAFATRCYNCCEEKCMRVETAGQGVRELMLMCKMQCSQHCGW